MFASLASIVQPAQWMRFYAARDSKVLRRTSILFATVLPLFFVFGVFLAGLGGRALYPMVDGQIPEILGKADQIVILVVSEGFPRLFGSFGILLTSLILVAVMAASMSTADSNLHALSAIVTRDIYDRLKPDSSEAGKAWTGRIVIVIAVGLALYLTFIGQVSESWASQMLATMGQFFLLAMAFSAQLLPVTFDVLFFRKGTRLGAIAGMYAGIFVILLFSPILSLIIGRETANTTQSYLKVIRQYIDLGLFGIFFNSIIFILVSRFTNPPDQDKVNSFMKDLMPN